MTPPDNQSTEGTVHGIFSINQSTENPSVLNKISIQIMPYILQIIANHVIDSTYTGNIFCFTANKAVLRQVSVS